jgi:hypothetical protein
VTPTDSWDELARAERLLMDVRNTAPLAIPMTISAILKVLYLLKQ